ncbi:MAG: mechanosensitive ion channel family protein, partial [Bacteroidota bacterium]
LDNTLYQYLIAFGILLLGFLLKRVSARIISRQSFRFVKGISHNRYSEVFVTLFLKPVEQFLTVMVIYFALDRLRFPAAWDIDPIDKFGVRWLIEALFEIAIIVVFTRIILRVIDFISYVFIHSEDTEVSKDLVRFIKELSKVLAIIISFFVILAQAFEVNITALIASLGIGGLAVALAAQDTIANLFGSFIIYLDKPFSVGDLVEAGEIKGHIEKIGFRTTRVRTLDRSLLTVPNKKMVDVALNNITQSTQRRVKFTLQLTYGAKSEHILNIIEQIKTEIDAHPDTCDETTVRFTEFGSSSLNILVVYYVNSNEFEKMIEVKEMLNLKIMHIVENNYCSFAFPTQTIHLEK